MVVRRRPEREGGAAGGERVVNGCRLGVASGPAVRWGRGGRWWPSASPRLPTFVSLPRRASGSTKPHWTGPDYVRAGSGQGADGRGTGRAPRGRGPLGGGHPRPAPFRARRENGPAGRGRSEGRG